MKACGSHLTLGEAVVAEILASLFLVLTFWKQINLRLSPDSSRLNSLLVGSARYTQSRNGWPGLTTIAVRLIVSSLSAPDAFPLRRPVDNSSSASRPTARDAGSLYHHKHGIHPG